MRGSRGSGSRAGLQSRILWARLADFTRTLEAEAGPPSGLSGLLEVLWHDARGDGDRAHRIAQEIDTRDSPRVHACLHREDNWTAIVSSRAASERVSTRCRSGASRDFAKAATMTDHGYAGGAGFGREPPGGRPISGLGGIGIASFFAGIGA